MEIGNKNLAITLPSGKTISASQVKITFTSPLPRGVTNKNLNAEIISRMPDGKFQLKLSSGKTVEARIEPALPIGTRIKFKVQLRGKIIVAKATEILPPQTNKNNQVKQKNIKQTGQVVAKDNLQPTQQNQLPQANQVTTQGQQTTKQQLLQSPIKQSKGEPVKIENPNLVTKTTNLPQRGEFIKIVQPPQTQTVKQSPALVAQTISKAIDFQINSKDIRGIYSKPIDIRTPAGSTFEVPTRPIVVNVKTPAPQGFTHVQPHDTKLPDFQIRSSSKLPQGSTLTLRTQPSTIPKDGAVIPTTNSQNTSVKVHPSMVHIIKASVPLPLTSPVKITSPLPISSTHVRLTPPQGEPPIPVNTPVDGKITSGQAQITREGMFQQTVKLIEGTRIKVESSAPLPENTNMTVKFTNLGSVEVLRVLPPESGGARNHGDTSFNLNKEGTAKNLQLPIGSTHTGAVTAQGEKGALTLTLKTGEQLQIQASKQWPIGTQVSIKITPDGNGQVLDIQLQTTTVKAQILTQFTNKWDNLQLALNKLAEHNPIKASQLVDKLPHVGKNMLPALIAFSQAVSSGNMERIADKETLDLLRAMGINLTADISSLSTLQQKTDGPDSWRALVFPYIEHEGDDPRQGSLYWRNKHNDETDKLEETRFVVGIELSNIGQVQLDGLMHKKHLNLHLRMESNLGANFEKGLKQALQSILKPLGLTGDITVKTTSFFEVDPFHDMLKENTQFNVTV